MRIALFGQSGQVATEIQRRIPDGTVLTVLGRDAVDFRSPEAVFAMAGNLRVDAVINAVAYTAVDQAESDNDIATVVNGTSVGALSRALNQTATPLVHLSTDYVFGGLGDTAHKPGDQTAPASVYGNTKLLGEQELRANGARHAVLRTSWVFSAHGSNFVKTMLRLSSGHDQLKIVEDQIGGPTPAAAIADACLLLSNSLKNGATGGTYHLSGSPDVSWADFAREIFQQTGSSASVIGIPTTEYPTPAQRPLNSRLDCESLENDFGIERPDWRLGLKDVLKELGAT